MIRKIKNVLFSLAFFTAIFTSTQGFGSDQETLDGSIYVSRGGIEKVEGYDGCALFGLPSIEQMAVKYDEFSKILPVFEQMRVTSGAIMGEWYDALLDLEGILSFENIFDSSQLIESKQKVIAVQEKLKNCKMKYDQAVAQMDSAIELVIFEDDCLETAIRYGMMIGKFIGLKLINDYFSTEQNVLELYDRTLDFFLETDGFFQVSDAHKLVFYRESDEEEYDILLIDFDKIAQEEKKILQQMGRFR